MNKPEPAITFAQWLRNRGKTLSPHHDGFVSGNGDKELPQFWAVHSDFPVEYFDTEIEAINALQRMRDFAATPNVARPYDKVVLSKYPRICS